MEDRLNKIDKLVSHLENNEVINENSVIVQQIKKKFKYLEFYTYKMDSKIRICYAIRYVNLELNKLSIPGIVVRIDYESTYSKNIKTILLYNKMKNIYWIISPKKVYLFVSNRINSSLGRDIADKILAEHVKYYKEANGIL